MAGNEKKIMNPLHGYLLGRRALLFFHRASSWRPDAPQ
jgi:hypothetical protein